LLEAQADAQDLARGPAALCSSPSTPQSTAVPRTRSGVLAAAPRRFPTCLLYGAPRGSRVADERRVKSVPHRRCCLAGARRRFRPQIRSPRLLGGAAPGSALFLDCQQGTALRVRSPGSHAGGGRARAPVSWAYRAPHPMGRHGTCLWGPEARVCGRQHSKTTLRAGLFIFDHATEIRLAGAGGTGVPVRGAPYDVTRRFAEFCRSVDAGLVGGAGNVAPREHFKFPRPPELRAKAA
jgi:hypothetical protein